MGREVLAFLGAKFNTLSSPGTRLDCRDSDGGGTNFGYQLLDGIPGRAVAAVPAIAC